MESFNHDFMPELNLNSLNHVKLQYSTVTGTTGCVAYAQTTKCASRPPFLPHTANYDWLRTMGPCIPRYAANVLILIVELMVGSLPFNYMARRIGRTPNFLSATPHSLHPTLNALFAKHNRPWLPALAPHPILTQYLHCFLQPPPPQHGHRRSVRVLQWPNGD